MDPLTFQTFRPLDFSPKTSRTADHFLESQPMPDSISVPSQASQAELDSLLGRLAKAHQLIECNWPAFEDLYRRIMADLQRDGSRKAFVTDEDRKNFAVMYVVLNRTIAQTYRQTEAGLDPRRN